MYEYSATRERHLEVRRELAELRREKAEIDVRIATLEVEGFDLRHLIERENAILYPPAGQGASSG